MKFDKLFGNSKRAKRVRGKQDTQQPIEVPIEEGRLDGKLRAYLLLGASALVFAFAIVMCLTLIRQSKDLEPYATQEREVKPIEYQVNSAPTAPITQSGEVEIELEAPVSVYDSNRINILLLGVEQDVNDTLILLSVDTAAREVSFLSIPRDTYVAGDYKTPKVNQIFKSYDEARRVGAVREALRGMLGFAPDYYFILDEAILGAMVDAVGGISFEIPKSPEYHDLKSGTQTLDGKSAFELFRFRNDWTDVETDPPRVQRDFLKTLFTQLLSDKDAIGKHCLAISEVADTDLTLGQIAYLAYMLADYDFDDAFSRALPGGEIEVEDEVFYQVDTEDAVEMLNERFNPLEKDLTIYTVSFRQKQRPSGEGQYSEYGHSSSTTASEDRDDEDTTEDEEPEESTEESVEESTEAPETEETTQAPETDASPEE